MSFENARSRRKLHACFAEPNQDAPAQTKGKEKGAGKIIIENELAPL